MKERHLNQSSLAREAGFAPSMISQVLAGQRRLYMDQAMPIARVLGCSVDYLVNDALDVDPHFRTPEERAILAVYRASGLSLEEAAGRLNAGPATRP